MPSARRPDALKFDAANSEVLVFTFKEGLLAAVAHDLKLKVERFSVEGEADRLSASFEAGSLKVVTTRRDGQDAAGLLPTVLYGEIEKNARDDVLGASKFPRVTFQTTAVGDAEVVGQLSLHGVTREVRLTRADTATHRVAETWLDVRDFGIKPYRAMLGTLKVQPRVQVVVRLRKEA